jgi:hypothetical protein
MTRNKPMPRSKKSDVSPSDAPAASAATPDDVDTAQAGKSPAEAGGDDCHPRSKFRSGSIAPPEAVRWVAANLNVRPVEPDEAPDSTSWALLRWAQSSPSSKAAFFQMWAKLLPSAELDDDQDDSDDQNDDYLDSLEFVYEAKRAAALRLGAERRAGEPRVPPQSLRSDPEKPA